MGLGCQRYAPAALPPGKTRYALFRKLSGPQGRFGRVRKISPTPGFDPRTVQPVASRYTHWAIPAHTHTHAQLRCRSTADKEDVCAPSHRASGPVSGSLCTRNDCHYTYNRMFCSFLCLVRHYSFRLFYFGLCCNFFPSCCIVGTSYNM